MDTTYRKDAGQELRDVSHSVIVTHYKRRTFIHPMNQLPLEQWMAPPHIAQVSFYDKHIGSATRITYTDVYELCLPPLEITTIEQIFDESKRVMAHLKEEKGKPSFFITNVQSGTFSEQLAHTLLMRPIYKNSHMKIMGIFQ
jgi:hypothetical protein